MNQHNLWSLPASGQYFEHDFGDEPPYDFHRRDKNEHTAQATALFTEMLCQIDPVMDAQLPVCYLYHAYLFALLDALRYQYMGAYIPVPTEKGLQLPMPTASAQFWKDEHNAVTLIKEFCERQGIDPNAPTCQHEQPATYSAKTEQRRDIYRKLGFRDAPYYPYATSTMAQADTFQPLPQSPVADSATAPEEGHAQQNGTTPDATGAVISTYEDM